MFYLFVYCIDYLSIYSKVLAISHHTNCSLIWQFTNYLQKIKYLDQHRAIIRWHFGNIFVICKLSFGPGPM